MRAPLVALALLIGASSCIYDSGPGPTPLPGGEHPPAASPAARARGGPVLGIGDSLLVGADEQGHLGAILALDGWELETIAERGRSVRWAIGELEDRDERVPRHIVVVLGSNPGFSADGFAEDARELLDALLRLGGRRILWLPPYHPDPERYAEKVAVLRSLDRSERRLVVPDWRAVLDAHPEWVVSDGIHLTEEGYAAMAVYIRDWLKRI